MRIVSPRWVGSQKTRMNIQFTIVEESRITNEQTFIISTTVTNGGGSLEMETGPECVTDIVLFQLHPRFCLEI